MGGNRFIIEQHSYSSYTTCFIWRILGGRGSSKITFNSIVQVIIKLSLILLPQPSKCRGYSYEPSHQGFIHIYFVPLYVKPEVNLGCLYLSLSYFLRQGLSLNLDLIKKLASGTGIPSPVSRMGISRLCLKALVVQACTTPLALMWVMEILLQFLGL